MNFLVDIQSISNFSQLLFIKGKFQESIQLYNRLLNVLNYYKLILVESPIYYEIDMFIQYVKNIETEVFAHDWHQVLWELILSTQLQIYNFSKADLSYCRSYKFELLHYYPSNSLLADYYSAIYENKHLSLVEKGRFYEMFYNSLRLSEVSFRYLEITVDDFRENRRLPNKISMPVWILGEPTALLFLRMWIGYN